MMKTNFVDLRLLVSAEAQSDWTATVPVEQIPAVLGELAALQLRLTARLLQEQADRTDQPAGSDTLLRVEEAAARLGTSKDWLYRQAKRLPFTVRQGRQLRFSSQGIDHHIKQRRGR